MSLLIDGYNLLNAVGIVGRGLGPGGLERSRLALLNFLAESLPPDQVARTTVVFDAGDAPRGLPGVARHRGLTVRFSAGYEDADALIEELIRAESAPRRLTVVSSDHRLHRAARRRKARAVDSDVWYDRVVAGRQAGPAPLHVRSAKPQVPLLDDDVERWLRRFGGESELQQFVEEQEADQHPRSEGPVPTDGPSDKPSLDEPEQFDNPFPPGYGEDLLDDQE